MSLRKSLILIVIVSGLIYLLVFSLPFPLSQFYHTIPPVDYAKLTNYSVSGFALYIVGLALLFGLYVKAIRLVQPRRQETSPSPSQGRFILASGAGLALILLFSYPVGAIDVLVYALYTRGWAVYGFNPMAVAPAHWPASDPWLGVAAEWVDAPSPYGPVWESMSLGTFHLSGGDFLAHVFALKILAILAYLGCVVLIYVLLRQSKPNWAAAGTIAFAWNPLVLLETAQNAHNDIVMIFFLLAAVWALTTTRRQGKETITMIFDGLVCLFLTLSILTKFITVIVAPFFLLALIGRRRTWRKRLAWLMGYGLFTAAIIVVAMWPLWPGWNNWALVQGADAAGRSIFALVVLSLRDALGGLGNAFEVSRTLLWGIFALIYGHSLWRLIRIIYRQYAIGTERTEAVNQQAILSSFLVLFWCVMLVMPIFHAWHLLWSLPLAVLLLPQRRPLIAAIVFSITALFIVPYFETIRVWFPVLLHDQLLGYVIGVPLLAVFPIAALLWPSRHGAHSQET